MKIGRKLTWGDVEEIRRRNSSGVAQGVLAREYRLSVNMVGKIVRFEAWNQAGSGEAPVRVLDTPALDAAALESQRRMMQSLDGLLDKGDSDA